MQFNSSIEKIEDIYQTYKECLSEIYDATTVITEALIGYAKKLKYEPVVNLAKDIVNYYNELKLDEIEVIDDWKRGQAFSMNTDISRSLTGQEIRSWRVCSNGSLSV